MWWCSCQTPIKGIAKLAGPKNHRRKNSKTVVGRQIHPWICPFLFPMKNGWIRVVPVLHFSSQKLTRRPWKINRKVQVVQRKKEKRMKMVRLLISQILVVNLINLIVLNDVRPSKYIYVYYINYVYIYIFITSIHRRHYLHHYQHPFPTKQWSTI